MEFDKSRYEVRIVIGMFGIVSLLIHSTLASAEIGAREKGGKRYEDERFGSVGMSWADTCPCLLFQAVSTGGRAETFSH